MDGTGTERSGRSLQLDEMTRAQGNCLPAARRARRLWPRKQIPQTLFQKTPPSNRPPANPTTHGARAAEWNAWR